MQHLQYEVKFTKALKREKMEKITNKLVRKYVMYMTKN